MPGIFISYRRDDVPGQVGRLFGRLAEHYGEDFVFMDVESINLAQDFEAVIKKRINEVGRHAARDRPEVAGAARCSPKANETSSGWSSTKRSPASARSARS